MSNLNDGCDQICIFPEQRFWIPAVDNDSRMWECPECGKRMFGEPLHWYQFNYYRFCPYCGMRLYTDPKLVDKGGLPDECANLDADT